MSKMRMTLIAALFLGQPAFVSAEDYSDPTWPCVQRKVEQLSLGLMWPHLAPENEAVQDLTPAAATLVDTLVLRRVSIDEVEDITADFAATNDHLTQDDYTDIFQAIFNKINRDRTDIIAGIGRYSLSQIDLATRIETARIDMDNEMAKQDPDFDKVDALEEQLDWDQRIYRDRAQSLLYVCETPVILEKRAYAIAQTLSHHLPG